MDDKDYESDSTVLVEDLSKNPEKIARKRRRLDAAIRRISRINIHASDVENTTSNVPNANLPINRRDRNNAPERYLIMNKYFDSSNNNNDRTAEEALMIERNLLKADGEATDCVVISDDSDDDRAIVTNELNKEVDKNTSLNPRISVLTPSAINNRRATLDSLDSNENASNVNSVNTAYPSKVNPKLTILKPAAIKKTVQDNVTICDNFTSNENKNKEISDNNKTKETNNGHVNETNWLSGQKSYGERSTKLNKNETSRKRNTDGVIQGIKNSHTKNTVLPPRSNDINNKEKAGVIKTAKRNKSTDSSDVMRSRADVFNRNNQETVKIQERVDTGEINSKDPSRTDAAHDKTAKMNDTDNINCGNDDINKYKKTTKQVKDQKGLVKKPKVIGVIDRSKNEKEKSRKRSKSIDAKRDAADRCALNTDASYGNVSNTDDVENPILQKLKNIIGQSNITNIVQAENTNELHNEQSNSGPDRHEKIDSNKITETNNREKKVRCADNRSELPSSGNSNVAININDSAPAKSSTRKSTSNMSVKSKKHEVTNLIVDDVTTKSNTLTNKTAISANNYVSTKTSKNQNKKLTTSIEISQQSCPTMPKDKNKSIDKKRLHSNNDKRQKSNDKGRADEETSEASEAKDNDGTPSSGANVARNEKSNCFNRLQYYIMCRMCGKLYANQIHYKKHLIKVHKVVADVRVCEDSIVWICPHCDLPLFGKKEYNGHVSKCSERPKCKSSCETSVSTIKSDFDNEIKGDDDEQKSNSSEVGGSDDDKDRSGDEDSPSSDGESNDCKSKDDSTKTAVAPYTCRICTCVFDSHASLLDHIDNNHNIPEKSNEIPCPLCNVRLTEANFLEHAREHEPDDTEVGGGNIATEITTNYGNVNVTDPDTQQQNKAVATSSDEQQCECRICKLVFPSSAKEIHKKEVHGHLDLKNKQLFKSPKKKVIEPKQANVIQSSACREDAVSAVNKPTLGSKEKKCIVDLDNEMNRREENRKNEVEEVAAKTGNNVEKDKHFEQSINDGTDQINPQSLNANYDTQKKTNQERKRKADDEHINRIQEAKPAHVTESQTEKTVDRRKCRICKTLFTDYGSREHRKEHPGYDNKKLFDPIKVKIMK